MESMNREGTDEDSDEEEGDAGGDIIRHLARQPRAFQGCSDAALSTTANATSTLTATR